LIMEIAPHTFGVYLLNNYEVNDLKSLTKFLILLIMISLVGFTLTNENENTDITTKQVEPVYVEETTAVNPVVEYINRGIMKASWYGPKFHGRSTANGEEYDQMAFTAAHKSFKFGTLLRVTNPKNDKQVIVRINDRGPYIPGRQLDLSKGAALALGLIARGVAKLNVEEVSLKGVNFPAVSLN